MTKTNHISVGNAGEYFVAGELERRGFSVAVPMSNVKDFDLLIFHRETHRKYSIQVKTRKDGYKSWPLNPKNEKITDADHFYIFVSLNGVGVQEYHIVPSSHVAKFIIEGHRKWLATPGRKGQKHNDNSLRKFDDFENEWLNRWDLLTGAATECEDAEKSRLQGLLDRGSTYAKERLILRSWKEEGLLDEDVVYKLLDLAMLNGKYQLSEESSRLVASVLCNEAEHSMRLGRVEDAYRLAMLTQIYGWMGDTDFDARCEDVKNKARQAMGASQNVDCIPDEEYMMMVNEQAFIMHRRYLEFVEMDQIKSDNSLSAEERDSRMQGVVERSRETEKMMAKHRELMMFMLSDLRL